VLQPLHALIEAHMLGAERLHGDDTNVPILARGNPPVMVSSRPDRRRSSLKETNCYLLPILL
jgi:hypothetical protein